MQIHLKQNEIIAAIQAYVAHQGINLSGKDVSVAFTAGRKETGISAEITIEDARIPGFTDSDDGEGQDVPNVAKPALAVVSSQEIPAEVILPEPVPGEIEPSAEAPAKATTSLFG